MKACWRGTKEENLGRALESEDEAGVHLEVGAKSPEVGQDRMPEVPNFRHPAYQVLEMRGTREEFRLARRLLYFAQMKETRVMDTRKQKLVVVEFFVTPSPDHRPLVENLVHGEGLTVNLRRARITSQDAWFQLDVSKTSDEVDAFVRRRKDELTVVTPVTGKVA
jgi:hypothetical protein